jgi:hypothetical protein
MPKQHGVGMPSCQNISDNHTEVLIVRTVMFAWVKQPILLTATQLLKKLSHVLLE